MFTFSSASSLAPSANTCVTSTTNDPQSDLNAIYLPIDVVTSNPSAVSSVPHFGSSEERSDKFWFEDGSVVFKVENMLFKVYKGIFTRHSSLFKSRITAVLESPPVRSIKYTYGGKKGRNISPSYETLKPEAPRLIGTGSESTPLVLNIAKSNFELLLSYMFPTDYECRYDFTPKEWLRIAYVADKLEMNSIGAVALSNICKSYCALELIDIGRKQDNHACYLEGFRTLSTREKSLTVEEGMHLGIECVIAISRARDMLARGTKWSEIENLVQFKVGVEAKEKDAEVTALKVARSEAEARARDAQAKEEEEAQARADAEARARVAEERAKKMEAMKRTDTEDTEYGEVPVASEDAPQVVDPVSEDDTELDKQVEVSEDEEPILAQGSFANAGRFGVQRGGWGSWGNSSGGDWDEFFSSVAERQKQTDM